MSPRTMARLIAVACAFCTYLVGSASFFASSPAAMSHQRSQPESAAPAEARRQLVDTYCVTCHNQKLKTAGLMLDSMDVQQVESARDTWEKVIRRVGSGTMPPAGARRPTPLELSAFTTSLERDLDRFAAQHPDP